VGYLASDLAPTITWVPFDSLARLLLALLVGLFVGLEREWRGKEAGLRTFGLASLLGAMGGMLGTPYALMCLGSMGVLLVFLNIQGMRTGQGTELTTSVALLVTSLSGVLCGLGHTITPVAVTVVTAGLLSWKERLAEFGHSLKAEEIRSAILLGILAFAVYPVLPAHPVDPWGLIAPRAAWLTVVLIAAIGFANYVLWKLFGTRGIEFAGFLGGLVNSTVTVGELSSRVRETGDALVGVAYRGVLLSVAAMAMRNALILGIFKPSALVVASAALGLMLAASVGLAFIARGSASQAGDERPLELRSPFSLRSALKFGVVFLVLQVLGSLAQSIFGKAGFYSVSVLGGLVSSASAVAAAAMLASHDRIPAAVAGVGSILASLASAAVNVALVARFSKSRVLTRRVGIATLVVVIVGLVGAFVTSRLAGAA
jgi:uncharacterized membrane protein (DUF4010 family)